MILAVLLLALGLGLIVAEVLFPSFGVLSVLAAAAIVGMVLIIGRSPCRVGRRGVRTPPPRAVRLPAFGRGSKRDAVPGAAGRGGAHEKSPGCPGLSSADRSANADERSRTSTGFYPH